MKDFGIARQALDCLNQKVMAHQTHFKLGF